MTKDSGGPVFGSPASIAGRSDPVGRRSRLLCFAAPGSWPRTRCTLYLEGPRSLSDPAIVRGDLIEAVDGVRDVRHIHAWSISRERPMITLNARTNEGAYGAEVVAAI